MNSQKYSAFPPLIYYEKINNNPGEKSKLFSNHFASKSTVLNFEDKIPKLSRKTCIDKINTSPIEVAKILRCLEKPQSSYCGIPEKFLSFISTPIYFFNVQVLQ